MRTTNLLLNLSVFFMKISSRCCTAFFIRSPLPISHSHNQVVLDNVSPLYSNKNSNPDFVDDPISRDSNYPSRKTYLFQNQMNRRSHFSKLGNVFFVSLFSNTLMNKPELASAKTGQVKTAQFAGKTAATKPVGSPKEAFEGLIKARDELRLAQTKYIKKKDMEGLRSYLTEEVTYISSFESYALSILASKMLSDEDKKEIGTIRRYGIGADVMIMYGGLMAEIDEMNDEPDPAVASKFLGRTLDSLNEVIQICKNNGFSE